MDRARFAQGTKVTRYAVNEVDSVDGVHRPHLWNAKPFTDDQVVLKTDKFYFVSRAGVAPGTRVPVLSQVSRDWSLVEEYAQRVSGRPNEMGVRGLGLGIRSDDLDRGLQTACDMGRWDVAFMMVVRAWDLGGVAPNMVIWDSFPHESSMAVVSGGRLFVPWGVARKVLENWWAAHGGWHCKVPLMADWAEYEAVMGGLRNPLRLAGLPETLPSVEKEARPVGVVPAALTPADLAERAWAYNDGVAYLANAKGTVLPYWYATGPEGSTGMAEAAWGEDVRNRLMGQMNLPILIARRLNAHCSRP